MAKRLLHDAAGSSVAMVSHVHRCGYKECMMMVFFTIYSDDNVYYLFVSGGIHIRVSTPVAPDTPWPQYAANATNAAQCSTPMPFQ